MSITLATGGRAAKTSVYDHLAWIYQDSGLLGALMCGVLDAPELVPAGATQAGDIIPRGQRAVQMATNRELKI